MAEILDVERAFETGCEETAEGRDERREAGHDEQMQLVRRIRDRRHRPSKLKKERKKQIGES